MRKLPDTAKRWFWRLVAAAAILSAIGHFSPTVVSPLMCKIYG